jgi:hypothetical protein
MVTRQRLTGTGGNQPQPPVIPMNKYLLLTAALATATPIIAADKPLLMKVYTVKDVERNGYQPLCTMLMPKDWKAESQIKWSLRSAQFPFESAQRFTAPDGDSVVEFLPVYQHNYLASPFGAPQGYAAPNTIEEGLGWLAAAARPNIKLKKIDTSATKLEVGRPVNNGVTITSTAEQTGTYTVSYTLNGEKYEEEFAATMHIQTTEAQGGVLSQQWFIYGVRAIRAKAGSLDEVRPIGVAMSRSARPTAEFMKAIEVAQGHVRNIQKHHMDLVELEGKMWREARRESSEKWQKVVDERWAAGDARNEQFRDVMGGVNRFKTTDGAEVLLPQSHKYAWEGPNGVYLITNDSGYRPDADFTGTWTNLKAK